MKDFDSILNIWNEQADNTPKVDYKELISRYKKSRNKFSAKIWIELIWMVLAAFTIGYLWATLSFNTWTTHIAMFIFELCCFYYIYTQIKNLKTLNNNSLLETPEKHIAYIEGFRKERFQQNTRNYYIYTLALALALGLYFIEFFNHVNTITLVLAVAFSITWFALCTFLIRVVYIRKEEKRFNELIAELERLKKQFTNQEN